MVIFSQPTKYLETSGVSNPFVIQILASSINVVSTLPGMWVIDRWKAVEHKAGSA